MYVNRKKIYDQDSGFLWMRLRISIRGHVCRSVRRSVGPSVGPRLFSNDEKSHIPSSNDGEILPGLRESQGQFKNDVRMSVRRSVRPSDIIFEE